MEKITAEEDAAATRGMRELVGLFAEAIGLRIAELLAQAGSPLLNNNVSLVGNTVTSLALLKVQCDTLQALHSASPAVARSLCTDIQNAVQKMLLILEWQNAAAATSQPPASEEKIDEKVGEAT